MTKEEFEREVRRVPGAFGFDAEMPLDCRHRTQTHSNNGELWPDGPTTLSSFTHRAELFDLNVSWYVTRTRDTFSIQVATTTGFIRFTDYLKPTPGHHVEFSGEQRPELSLVFIRALFLLGYSIDSIAERAGMVITVHEKLQWHLENKEKFSLEKDGEAT